MATNEHVVRFNLDYDGTMHVHWLDGPEDGRPARIRPLGMKPGDVRVVRVRSYAGQMLDWEIVSTRNVGDMAPNTTTRWHGSRRDMADAVTGARQAYERAQRRHAKEREALMQAGWLTAHDRIPVKPQEPWPEPAAQQNQESRKRQNVHALIDMAEGIAAIADGRHDEATRAFVSATMRLSDDELSRAVSIDDAVKPEPQPETEGQRLARFFATSAHEGHDARNWPALKGAPTPDDRVWEIEDGCVRATFVDQSCAWVRHQWTSGAVHEGSVWADERHNAFVTVPDAIIDEVRGTLRSWARMEGKGRG